MMNALDISQTYFANAAVETAPDELPTGVDIRIILGTGES